MSHSISVIYNSTNGAHRNKIDGMIEQCHGKIIENHASPKSEGLSWWARRWSWRTTFVKQKRASRTTTLYVDFPTWADAARFRQAVERLEWANVRDY